MEVSRLLPDDTHLFTCLLVILFIFHQIFESIGLIVHIFLGQPNEDETWDFLYRVARKTYMVTKWILLILYARFRGFLSALFPGYLIPGPADFTRWGTAALKKVMSLREVPGKAKAAPRQIRKAYRKWRGKDDDSEAETESSGSEAWEGDVQTPWERRRAAVRNAGRMVGLIFGSLCGAVFFLPKRLLARVSRPRRAPPAPPPGEESAELVGEEPGTPGQPDLPGPPRGGQQ